MENFCPGAKLVRAPKLETISCTSCGKELEIWTDETKATCPDCNKTTNRESAAKKS